MTYSIGAAAQRAPRPLDATRCRRPVQILALYFTSPEAQAQKIGSETMNKVKSVRMNPC
jgi:hypothetical protein